MPDFRTMYDSDYLYHFDLPAGRDVVVTMERCKPGTVTGTGGKKSKKPLLYFQGKKKGLALCKTNGKTIAGLYGPNTDAWAGKKISLYATTTTFGSETVGCIRIRPSVPGASAQEAPPDQIEPSDASDVDGQEQAP